MGDFRKVPSSGYGRGDVVTSITLGMILILMGWVLVFLGSSNTFSINFKEIGFLKVFSLVFGLALVIFGLFGLGEGISLSKAKKSWLSSALRAQTHILQCKKVDNNTDYAAYYGEPSTYWYLKLKPIPEQSAVQPNTTPVSVSIRESQYKTMKVKLLLLFIIRQ